MLTRESQLSLGKAFEAGYVGEKAKEPLRDASSVPDHGSLHSRHAGSSTKRVQADGLSLTVPRGDSLSAKKSALSEKSDRGSNSSFVFVLSKNKKPLMPTTQSRGQELLRKGRAVVHKIFPFTIRLKDRTDGATQPVSLKLDPGSKVTGIAIAREAEGLTVPLFLAELTHRGPLISKCLQRRGGYRRRRRSSNLRYRPQRFLNRIKPEGWLAPSLQHRVNSTMSWVHKLRKICPVTEIWSELVRFDLQQMQNPETQGVEYQQGTLFGYEVREYLLEKWNRSCTYCGITGVPLQIEHILAKARGGTNRISNLCLACKKCNQKKSDKPIEEFLKKQPDLLQKILGQRGIPLKDIAVMNATRWTLVRMLKMTGLPLTTASGGRTKGTRIRLGIPKSHCLDALCVGEVENLGPWGLPVLEIKSMGRGSYQRTRVTSSGFPRGHLMRSKSVHGFQTGDIARVLISHGKHKGTYVGSLAVRARGQFQLRGRENLLLDISYKYCTLLTRASGYSFSARREKMRIPFK